MQVEVWQQMQPSITNRTRAFPEYGFQFSLKFNQRKYTIGFISFMQFSGYNPKARNGLYIFQLNRVKGKL